MKDKHLILDLDSTLIFATDDINSIKGIYRDPKYEEYKDRIRKITIVDSSDGRDYGYGRCCTFVVILRPHFEEFRDYITKNFKSYSIWSAGQYRYVRAIESILFPHENNLESYPCEPFLSRGECEMTNVSVLKDVEKYGFDMSKTLILDDRNDTFSKNPDNAIHIPRYEPQFDYSGIYNGDKCLLETINWFKDSNIMNCEDVRTINKNNIYSN